CKTGGAHRFEEEATRTELPLHKRWHPDIPPVAEVKVGEVFRVKKVDCSGGGITKEYTAEDIKHADISTVSLFTLSSRSLSAYTELLSTLGKHKT
ncbi:unnamed protein product, partial [Ilex paraguariensis]